MNYITVLTIELQVPNSTYIKNAELFAIVFFNIVQRRKTNRLIFYVNIIFVTDKG